MNLVAWIGGIVLGAVVSFFLGYLVRSRLGRLRLQSAERQSAALVEQAGRDAETVKRNAILEGREEALRLKQQVEREMLAARNNQLAAERAFQEKEVAFNRRVELIEKKERDLKRTETDLGQRETQVQARDQELNRLIQAQTESLERVAGMSADEARSQLVASIESEARAEASRRLAEVRENAQRNAEREARKIILLAIQRYAADHVSDSAVSVVHLPSDDMKGRIIGREGRNIRSFEIITGVDVIIDDTPEAVILSGFDPVRREIARLSLERLVADGRIHPARIEEVVAKVKSEVEGKIREFGEMSCLEVGVHGIHPELQNLLGRLHYRTSYGQNILRHSIEVAHLSGMMAAEIGMNQKMAKRAGLLHDIGKAVDHEHEGSHPALGMEIAARYGEPEPVLEAIGYHHDDYAGGSLWPVLRRWRRSPPPSPGWRRPTPSRPAARSASWSSTRRSTTRGPRAWRGRSRARSRRSWSIRDRSG
jgi:ribonuclease Y